MKQIRGIVIRRLIQLFTKIAEEDDDKFAEIQKVYRTILKLGAAEDEKNRQKIASLVRFSTNRRNSTSLDDVGMQFDWEYTFLIVVQYIKNKKQGQKQACTASMVFVNDWLCGPADILSR